MIWTLHQRKKKLLINNGIFISFVLTGCDYRQLRLDFAVGISTISAIVPQVCMAIIQKFGHLIRLPANAAEWRAVAARYQERWNFPNTLGAVDGKHIRIK